MSEQADAEFCRAAGIDPVSLPDECITWTYNSETGITSTSHPKALAYLKYSSAHIEWCEGKLAEARLRAYQDERDALIARLAIWLSLASTLFTLLWRFHA